MDMRLAGTFTLRAPLSHIGESISTTSYLVQEPILQEDGSLEEVFCYSGNAWRGQLRDLMAAYMLDRLGFSGLTLDAFHLLFTGGRIGGDQTINVAQAREYRRAIPMLALFGGGVGNQILPGKARVGNCYPVCLEALPVLPPALHGDAALVSYRGLTVEKSFSRKDDGKDDRLTPYLAALADLTPAAEPAQIEAPATPDQVDLFGETVAPAAPASKPTRPPKARREDGGTADQMRFTSELLVAGTRLATRIDLLSVSDVELGCLVSGLTRFARAPFIGGQSSRGHGLVDLVYAMTDLDTGEQQPFLSVADGIPSLAPPAEQAKAAYDGFLDSYHAAIDAAAPTIRGMLVGGSKS